MYAVKRSMALYLTLVALTEMAPAQNNHLVWDVGSYKVYRDSIVQGGFVARAISAKELESDYKSPANLFKSAEINFKFSINGKDNEMHPGTDHHFICQAQNGMCETPLIKFGTQLHAKPSENHYLEPNTLLKIRVDMRDVLQDFKTKGYYITYKGDKIYKEDFKGVYVAGNTSPLIWDFDNLVNHQQLQLKDEDGDGIYEVSLLLNSTVESTGTASRWQMTKDLKAFPSYASDFTISDALYHLAMEEMVRAIEPDSTFRTGKEWAGVWTRDISYSIILSMAHLQPAVAKNSLLRKVNKRKRIIQDTGTGGAWPVSTDRMIWAVAAWELYKVTGNKDWLEQAYAIVKNSIDDDLQTIYDPATGLVKGESSFLDWREQTYPRWMQPADIAESECLGTNAVHYQALVVLHKMAMALHYEKAAAKYLRAADKIKRGINTYLWLPEKNYYGQFLYGRGHKIVSPKSEALGEALCVLFDITDKERQKKVIEHTPVTPFGIPCIFPEIPDIPPYHNNAVWPFVQTYWLWASAKAANETSVMESIAAVYRPAAMFLTNKENYVAENGDFLGTQINSSNMLWSLSGNISIVHRILFGLRFHENGLGFEPFVPFSLEGKRSLTNFAYRNSVLDIELDGHGNKIKHFYLDGRETHPYEVPPTLKGKHVIKIILAGDKLPMQNIRKIPVHATLNTPELVYTNGELRWDKNSAAVSYKIIRNGIFLKNTTQNHLPVEEKGYAEYQVMAIDDQGYESFASEPHVVAENGRIKIIEAEDYATRASYSYNGFTGAGFVEISGDTNRMVNFPVEMESDGDYLIDFHYANGNGPVNTENKCAIRTLVIDGSAAGTALFPQRGKDEWSNWGYGNQLRVHLVKGRHIISLQFKEWNNNMNGDINQAMVDHIRIAKL